jgi:hypothetical protein
MKLQLPFFENENKTPWEQRAVLLLLIGFLGSSVFFIYSLYWYEVINIGIVSGSLLLLVRKRRDGQLGQYISRFIAPLIFIFFASQFNEFRNEGASVYWSTTYNKVVLLILFLLVIFISLFFCKKENGKKNLSWFEFDRYEKLTLWFCFAIFLLSVFSSWETEKGLQSVISCLIVIEFVAAFFILNRFFRSTHEENVFLFIKSGMVVLFVVSLISFSRFINLALIENQAERLIEDGDYSSASQKYIELIKKNGDSFNLPFYALAPVIAGARDRPEVDYGISAYLRASINEKFASSLKQWSEIRADYDTALVSGVINHGSLKFEIYDKFGIALFHLHEWDELAQLNEQALVEFPASPIFLFSDLVAQVRMGKLQAAARSLEELIELGKAEIDEGHLDFQENKLTEIKQIGEVLFPGRNWIYEALSLYDIVSVFQIAQLEVLHFGEMIGTTGVKTPINLWVKSAGWGYGKTGVGSGNSLVSGAQRRGYNLSVFDPLTGENIRNELFDTWAGPEISDGMLNWVESIPEGMIVVAFVHDEGTSNLTQAGLQALHKIGGSEDLRGRLRWAHALIGVKGALPGSAIERFDPQRVEVGVLVGNMPAELLDEREDKLLGRLRNLTATTQKQILLLSGTKANCIFAVVTPD